MKQKRRENKFHDSDWIYRKVRKKKKVAREREQKGEWERERERKHNWGKVRENENKVERGWHGRLVWEVAETCQEGRGCFIKCVALEKKVPGNFQMLQRLLITRDTPHLKQSDTFSVPLFLGEKNGLCLLLHTSNIIGVYKNFYKRGLFILY